MRQAFREMMLDHGHTHDHHQEGDTSSDHMAELPLKTVEERTAARLEGYFSDEDGALLDQFYYARKWAHILDLNRAYLRGENVRLQTLARLQSITL